MCLDKAYRSKKVELEIVEGGYIPYIGHRREKEKRVFHRKHHRARRWVVEKERTNSWHNNRCRKLFTRNEKK